MKDLIETIIENAFGIAMSLLVLGFLALLVYTVIDKDHEEQKERERQEQRDLQMQRMEILIQQLTKERE